jgi:hypothetical protein
MFRSEKHHLQVRDNSRRKGDFILQNSIADKWLPLVEKQSPDSKK